MSWIILNWFLVFGLVPAQNEYVDYKAATLSTEAIATVAQLGAEVILWDRLSFFGDIENFQYFKGNSELIAGAFIPLSIRRDETKYSFPRYKLVL